MGAKKNKKRKDINISGNDNEDIKNRKNIQTGRPV